MDKKIDYLRSVLAKTKYYFLPVLLCISLLLLHRYIFLYADDLYYSRDAQYGLSNLPHFAFSELKSNGRVWIGLAMLGVLKNQIDFFRIINPLVIALTALLLAKMSLYSPNNIAPLPKKRGLAIFSACMFFWVLPIEISGTTIYYAATSFNYLYPTALVMLYAIILYSSYNEDKVTGSSLGLVILAFLAGASTQQAAMIAIGYTLLITLYLKLARKKEIIRRFIPYDLALLAGFSMIIYGSFHRLLYEQQAGNEINLPEAINGLVKVNIFSRPAAIFVLLTCLCCFFWFYYFGIKYPKRTKALSIICSLFLLSLAIGILSYIYILLYKQYPAEVFTGGIINGKLGWYLIAFVLLYLVSLLFITSMIMWKEKNPLLLFASINAIGAQLMLLAVDSRFAHTYKVMFPSLLLLSVFILYSILKFYRNKPFIALVVIVAVLPYSFGSEIKYLLFISLVMVLLIGMNFRFFFIGSAALFMGLGLLIFGFTYTGYREQAHPQLYNLQMIEQYHQSKNLGNLKLKKVPQSQYGYNLDNWNNMPYFMKQCYGINPQTLIKYTD